MKNLYEMMWMIERPDGHLYPACRFYRYQVKNDFCMECGFDSWTQAKAKGYKAIKVQVIPFKGKWR